MRNLSYSFLLFCTLLGATSLQATHNVAGEILYRKTGPLTVEAWIVTYSKASSVNADRDSLTICWGDGLCETVLRTNGNGEGEIVAPDRKRNVYLGTHTYLAAGQYNIYLTDPNRISGILNVNAPSSDNIPFHLQSTVSFLAGAAASAASPVLLEYPLDDGMVGQPFEHLVNAFDADGDSLAYELVVPMQGENALAPNYQFPTEIMPGSNNTLTLDPVSGKIVWDAPQKAGYYTITILIKSYRNGQVVETILRDMLINIAPDDGFNQAPVVQMSVPDGSVIDVQAGDAVQVDVTVSDPNAGQTPEISSSSALYDQFQQAAGFTVDAQGVGHFTWNVLPEQVREQPYLVVFKAKDQVNSGAGLASFKVAVFRVSQTTAVRPGPAETAALRVYPNPATGDAQVEIPATVTGKLRLRVLNEQGAIVQEEEIPAGTSSRSLRLTRLPAAAYTVFLSDGGNAVWLGRVVKR